MPDRIGTEPEDPILLAAIDTLRRPVGPNRGVDRALHSLGAERRRRRGWWLAAAAVALLGVGLGGLSARRATRPVRFAVRAQEARQVVLVGDFNDWNRAAVRLERNGAEWSVTLRLRPGRYRYSFLADGSHWIGDRRVPAVEDDFDTPTSVVTVAN